MSVNKSGENNSNTISLADEEAVKKVFVDTVFGLWDIVNNLTRLRPSKRDRYRVTIFGSARANFCELTFTRIEQFMRIRSG